jgi:glycerol uptake facilitator-like aquaporin
MAINIIIQLVSGIMAASFFAFFYNNLVKKKPSRVILTIIASVTNLFMGFASDFSILLKIILFLIGIPIYYYSLTDDNEWLNEVYKSKISKFFIFIVLILIIAVTIYFINYNQNPKY